MKIDYHIHTKLCKHASGEMEDYVERAIELKFDEIAFTDHIPLPDGFDITHRMSLEQLDGYAEAIFKLQNRYPEITILPGIEADFYEGFEDFLCDTFRRFPFEIIILSVHFLKHWTDKNWVFSYCFPDKSLSEIYSEYLSAVEKGIRTGLFNVVGHLDLIKQPDEPLLKHNERELRGILSLVKKQNMALEINTSGLRKQIGETYPHSSIFPLLAEYQIPVTLGSDAHAPHQVGYAFDRVENELANTEGLSKVRLRNGRMILVPWHEALENKQSEA
ncbi:MAG: histidinol-phosphatase HisJ [Calditrichaeota bacterium]|nr:histidinol-phosphatase HisJ [Calditrichota bacterium]